MYNRLHILRWELCVSVILPSLRCKQMSLLYKLTSLIKCQAGMDWTKAVSRSPCFLHTHKCLHKWTRWEKKWRAGMLIIIIVSHYRLNEIESIINFMGCSCCCMSDYKSKLCFMGLRGNKNLQYTASCHCYLPCYILINAAFLVLTLCLPQSCFSWHTLLILDSTSGMAPT